MSREILLQYIFSTPAAWKGNTYSSLGVKYIDLEILYSPHVFLDTKAAEILKALFV